jgi:hypothetical protein
MLWAKPRHTEFRAKKQTQACTANLSLTNLLNTCIEEKTVSSINGASKIAFPHAEESICIPIFECMSTQNKLKT